MSLSAALLLVVAKPEIDAGALELLKVAATRLKNLNSLELTATRTLERKAPVSGQSSQIIRNEIQVKILRPNFALIRSALSTRKAGEKSWERIPDWRTFASDGHQAWLLYGHRKEYRASSPSYIDIKELAPLNGLFGQSESLLDKVKLLQDQDLLTSLKLRNKNTVVIQYRQVGSEEVVKETHTFNAQRIEVRTLVEWLTDNRTATFELKDIKVNRAIPKANFTFELPEGYRLAEAKDFQRKPLLPIGSPAPGFTVTDPKNQPVRLQDFRSQVLVLDFWASWCGPCLQSLPQLNALAAKYETFGVRFLSVDVGDTPKVFQRWLAQNHYPNLQFAIDPAGIRGKGIDTRLFNAGSLPTTFVIDAKSRVRASLVGYGGNLDELEQSIRIAISP
ncbi:MAG: hypothetical protein BGO01_04890 [Armatimonadetes bacterium 55-13]|nr:redoxin domain-containing protein [Armatimonadota bacterium]OJU61425.1 MAG: hypothetical protein BGO01_04890 [Armatimonadetes bacterium 55-13]